MATKKPNKRMRPHPLRRSVSDICDTGKIPPGSVFTVIPGVGTLTLSREGPSLSMHFHSHLCNCTADVIWIPREKLATLLEQADIPITRVVSETEHGSSAQHYLGEEYLDYVHAAMKNGVKIAMFTFSIPSKVLRKTLTQLERHVEKR